MQPYFFPYAGYFRLFTAADTFVILDCVQLPRPGWVHRNRFQTATGEQAWLTLPLAQASHTTAIKDLTLRPGASKALESSLRRFPVLYRAFQARQDLVRRMVDIAGDDLTSYLHELIAHVTTLLGIAKPMVRSSALGIDADLRGQERVLAIVKALGAKRYVNAPGGRHLYDSESFARAGVELRFLSDYGSKMDSILSRLLTEPADAVSEEIHRETRLLT